MEAIIQNTVKFLKALGDSTRLEIIDLLKKGEITSTEIQDSLKKSQSTISQHLKTLLDAGIIKFRTDGKKIYSINDPDLFKILNLFQSFITKIQNEKIEELSQLGVLDTLL